MVFSGFFIPLAANIMRIAGLAKRQSYCFSDKDGLFQRLAGSAFMGRWWGTWG
jgi:hypothetical protein